MIRFAFGLAVGVILMALFTIALDDSSVQIRSAYAPESSQDPGACLPTGTGSLTN